MTASPSRIGDHLREWRQRRRLSQLDLALEAEISTRHLSFVETGRASPSREMVLRLAEHLAVPLRERNVLLAAAGYAPVFAERSLDDPALKAARAAVDLVLKGHEPYPALAVDRHWIMLAANASVAPLLAGVAPHLLEPPVNVLRLGLHPEGLAPRVENFVEWRAHILHRLRQQIEATADPVLVELLNDLRATPAPRSTGAHEDAYGGVVVPLKLQTLHGTLTLFSTITVFGTPVDITLQELAIEAFYPADPATGDLLRQLANA
jgi:transcriptional regulator with XRE-family HTH domain